MLRKNKLVDGLEYQRFDIATDSGLAKAKADLVQHRVLGLDIETTCLQPAEGRIRTIQLGYLVEDAKPVCYVIDLFALPRGLEVLADLFDGSHCIVGQNLAFESKWLEHHGGIRMRMPLFDTMIADRLLFLGDPQFPSYRGLADLCEHYLKVQLDKSLQVGGWDIDPPGELKPEKAHYAALDVVFALLLRLPLLARLKQETGHQERKPFPCPQDVFENEVKRHAWPHKPPKNLMVAAGLEFSIVPVVASMELMGMRCDMEVWNKLTKQLEIAEASAYTDMVEAFDAFSADVTGHELERDLVGDLDVSFSSSEQVINLFDQLGIPVPTAEDRKTGKTKRTVDQNKLKDGLIADYPPIAAYLRWKELHTGLTKAHKQHEYINPTTGKLHPRFNQLGASTGRFSAMAPNVQQVSRPVKVVIDGEEVVIDFRTAYKADPGWKFCGADLDQIELRMPGALCPDDNMRLQFFDEDCDPHANTARLLNNIPNSEEVPKALRTSAKIVNFSSLYLISPPKLRAYAKALYDLDMTVEEAQDILDNFREAYPGIASWHELAKDEARRSKGAAERANHAAETNEENAISARWEVYTVSGRRRLLIGDAVTAPNVAATKIQGSGADVVKKAMADIPAMLEKAGCPRARLVGQIHDELILHAPDVEADRAAKVLETALMNAGKYWFKGVVPITCKAEIGGSWSECH